MVIAVPLALVIALLLVELVHPAVARVVGTAIEMLAAIPSIIFGMVGIFVIVPFIQDKLVPWVLTTPLGNLPGHQARAAVPGRRSCRSSPPASCSPSWCCRSSRPSLATCSKMVPQVTKEAGYGMGSTTWEVMRKISLRYANSGIVGAVFIGLGRALGETMAVAYLIGSLSTRTCRARSSTPARRSPRSSRSSSARRPTRSR